MQRYIVPAADYYDVFPPVGEIGFFTALGVFFAHFPLVCAMSAGAAAAAVSTNFPHFPHFFSSFNFLFLQPNLDSRSLTVSVIHTYTDSIGISFCTLFS